MVGAALGAADESYTLGEGANAEQRQQNARFIAASPQMVDDLLSEIDRLVGENQMYRHYGADAKELDATIAEQRAEIDRLHSALAADDTIFRWLLGEEGEFPESLPGRRYNFRTELQKRLAARTPTPETPT